MVPGACISVNSRSVGVAASAVMVVLPYYLHDVKVFGRITIVGEFLAVTAVIMCILFILVDLGDAVAAAEYHALPLRRDRSCSGTWSYRTGISSSIF